MTPDTTQALIEEVKRRAGELKAAREKATEGPWALCGCSKQHVRTDAGKTEYRLYKISHKSDAAFIAHAANESIPLADLALRLARVVDCLDGALENYTKDHSIEIPLGNGTTTRWMGLSGGPSMARQAREQARKIACGEK